ncbi:hypothetical protein BHE90_017690 [Fusarium euwallaceae]|uniref:Uncharacterized protein n=1 Tax=Fusarium euwallaceae TaxID=1147111 RepID=A0A430KWQ2_9HYPO|nr:hypothetical protein BHE90_017690 [Fusarium euwallaceae]
MYESLSAPLEWRQARTAVRACQEPFPIGLDLVGYPLLHLGNYGEGFVGDYGDYGDGLVGDYSEENACQNHPELEQCMNQVIEIARVQSEQ